MTLKQDNVYRDAWSVATRKVLGDDIFLPAGGATAGQWSINRPNIAGLGLQQNEDSVRNHLIEEREYFYLQR